MKLCRSIKKLAVVTTILGLSLALPLSGCQPSRKPLPPPAPTPRVIPERTYPSKNPAITAEETNGLNNKLSAAVKGIKDVRMATVMVTGTTAYAGFQVNQGVEKARLEAIRSQAATVIKKTEPRIRTVFTATNPTTVRRIDRVRAAVRSKKPASTYASDLRSILNESDLVR